MNKLSTVLLVIGLMTSAQASAQQYFTTGVITFCEGECSSFAFSDVGTVISGQYQMDVTGGGTWDHTDLRNHFLFFENPMSPLEPYNGSNPTTANPFPLLRSTAPVRASAGGMTTGGTTDILGVSTGVLLFQFIVPPFDGADTWLIVTLNPDTSATGRMCTFFQTAGCIPGATQTFFFEGGVDLVIDNPFVFNPASLDFGPVTTGSSAQAQVTVTNNSDFGIDVGANIIGLQPPFTFDADTCSNQIVLPLADCTLTVGFSPTSVGNFSDFISVDPPPMADGVDYPVSGEGVESVDTDGDGISDDTDNCTLVDNATQLDSNGDDYGNACDPDLDNNGVVNFLDASIFGGLFGPGTGDGDFNGDGNTNFLDYSIFPAYFGGPPGPSGLAP